MKLQKKPIPQEQRVEKITIPGELSSTLEDYANYYEYTYHQKISLHDLMLEMLSAFMKSDRDFKQWSKNKDSITAESHQKLPEKTSTD